MGRKGRKLKQVLDESKEMRMLEFEEGNSRSHSVENWLWERL
jgi:hypothetical protein